MAGIKDGGIDLKDLVTGSSAMAEELKEATGAIKDFINEVKNMKNTDLKIKMDFTSVDKGSKALEKFNNLLIKTKNGEVKLKGNTLSKINNYYKSQERAEKDLINKWNKYASDVNTGLYDFGAYNKEDGSKDKANDIYRYANAFEALGGDLSKVNPQLKEFVETLRNTKLTTDPNNDYTVEKFKEVFSLLDDLRKEGAVSIDDSFTPLTEGLPKVINLLDAVKTKAKEVREETSRQSGPTDVTNSGIGSNVISNNDLSKQIHQQENLEQSVKNTTNALKEQKVSYEQVYTIFREFFNLSERLAEQEKGRTGLDKLNYNLALKKQYGDYTGFSLIHLKKQEELENLGKGVNFREIFEPEEYFDSQWIQRDAQNDLQDLFSNATITSNNFVEVLKNICNILGVEIPENANLSLEAIQDGFSQRLSLISNDDWQSGLPINEIKAINDYLIETGRSLNYNIDKTAELNKALEIINKIKFGNFDDVYKFLANSNDAVKDLFISLTDSSRVLQRGNLYDHSRSFDGTDYLDSTLRYYQQQISEEQEKLNQTKQEELNLEQQISSEENRQVSQIEETISCYEKLLNLFYKIKTVDRSNYSKKGNYNYITDGYSTREEAISDDLKHKKENLNSSLNVILSDDENALKSLEDEANRLKLSLQQVDEMVRRISSNSSIKVLNQDRGSENWYKGYAEAYKVIDDRLGELNNQYRLTNQELEEYITLQMKAEKIMDEMIAHNGGIQGSGAKNRHELETWIEKSFARDLGINPEEIYNGLFGNISDALYEGHMSLYDDSGEKRNLRYIAGEILGYQSITSSISGGYGTDEDAKKLREINTILTYIKNNINEINTTDFSNKIKEMSGLVDYYSQKISDGENVDFYSTQLTDAQNKLQELILLQERLNNARGIKSDSTQSFNEEPSGQLALPIDGVKEASFSIQNAQEEVQSEIKETNDVIEGQINLFSYLADANRQASKTINDTALSEEKKDIKQTESITKNDELNNMEALRKKVPEVTSAVGEKTKAFKAEEDAVTLNVEAEINKLQELINKIGEVASAIDNIGKNHTIDLKIDESTATALSGLKQSLEGGWTENLTELSTLINGLRLKDNVGENMQKLANAVLNLKSNLNNLSEGGANFLSSINTLVGQGDDLKALATVLKATKSEIAKVKNASDSTSKEDKKLKNEQTKASYDKEIRLLEEINRLEIQNKNASNETKRANEEKINQIKAEIEAERSLRKEKGLTSEKEQERVNNKKDKLQTKLDNTANQEYLDLIKKTINVEKEFQTLNAKKDNGVITSKELERLQQLEVERTNLNNKIAETIELTTKEINKRDELYKLRDNQTVYNERSSEYSSAKTTNGNLGIIDDTNSKMQSIANSGLIGLDSEIASAKQKIADLNAEFLRGSKDLSQYEREVARVFKQFDNVLGKNMTKNQGIDALKNKVKDLVAEMNGSNLNFKGINTAKNGIVELTYSFNNAEGEAQEMIATLTLLDGKFKTTANSAKSTSAIGNAFTSWEEGIKRALKYLTSFVSVYQLINVVRRGVNTVIDFDTALTEMRKVSDESIDSLRNFQAESFSLADGVGTTALQIQQSTAEFMRLGESLEEAGESAQAANMLLNVSEFDSIDEATQSLIAMKAAYDDLEQMDIIDKLNLIGNNFAISTDGLATALQASASALKTAGNDIDSAIALTTAGNAVVQDPDKVGAGIRTIALRLTGTKEAKAELEELGEETDGVATTVSKLRDTILTATKVESNDFKGFDILDDNGNYKSTYEIMLGIAEVYKEIVETDKKYGDNKANLLLETIAGKNRSNIAASILMSPETLKDAYEQSKFDSEGSSKKELNTYLESLRASIQEFKNALQELANTAIDSGFLENIINAGTTLVKVLDTLIEKTNTWVVLGSAIMGFSFIKKGMMDKGLIEPKKTLAGTLPGMLKSIFFKSNTASAVEETAEAIGDVAEESTRASFSFSNLGTSAKGFFTGLGSGVKTLWSSLNVLGKLTVGLGAAYAIFQVGYAIYDHFNESTEEMIEKSEKAADTIKSIKDEFQKTENTVSSISERFAKLAQGVDMLTGKNISLSDSEYAEFLDLSNQLAEIFPTLSRNYDENGNAIVQLSGDTDTMVGSLEALLEVQRQLANQKIVDELPDLYKGAFAKSKPIEQEINDLEAQRDALNREYQQLTSENFIKDFSNSISNGMISVKSDNLEQLYAISNNYKKVLDELGLSYTELTPDYGYDSDGIQVPVGVNLRIDSFTTGELDEDEVKAKSLEIAEAVQGVASEYNDSMNKMLDDIKTKQNENKANWSSVLSGISSWLSTDTSYTVMSDDMQSAAQSLINSLDFGELDYSNWDDFSNYLKESIITPLANLKGDAKEAFIDAWTGLSSLDIKSLPAKEYVNKVNGYIDTIASSLGMDDEQKKELKINLGFDVDLTDEQVERMRSQIKEALPDISDETIDGFTLAELNVAVKVSENAKERVDEELDRILTSERTKLESEMLELQKGGSVNLLLRPKVDYSEMKKMYEDYADDYSTLYSSTFSNKDETIAMNFTPIVADPKTGRYIKTLTDKELEKYAQDVIDGVREDDLNLKIGATFEGEEAVKQAEEAAKRISKLQSEYYDEFYNKNYKVDTSTVEKATGEALKHQMDIYKYLGEDAMRSAQDIMTDIDFELNKTITNYKQATSVFLTGLSALTGTGNIVGPIKSAAEQTYDLLAQNASNLNPIFVNNVDNYINKANELKVALNKISDGTLQNSDLDRLRDLGVEVDNVTELDDAIREMLSGMNADMLDEFTSQFGKVNSASDRRELERFMTTVLKVGEVVGNTAFSINIETETEGYTSLATAMQESVSATGLSSESISNLKNRYGELESKGYDLDKMFEETTNGIHLNRKAFNDLEDAYQESKTEQISDKVDELRRQYNDLLNQIEECSDPSVLQALYSRRDALVKEMNAVAETAAQYSGLASAYNKWQREVQAGNERDMYEGVISGFEEIKDEMSRGWFDDDTVAFLELMTGKDISSLPIEKQIDAYKDLSKAINSAGYSVKDFFTANGDGESTAKGVYNFLDTINADDVLGKAVTVDKDGNYSFDFSLVAEKDENGNIIKNGDQVIAEALGISEELVQIILRAADDAGFTINLEGAYTQLADLKKGAEEAVNALKLLKNTDNFSAMRLAGLDLEFDFDATGDKLVTEYEKAQALIDRYKVNGKVDLSVEGAEEAAEIAWFYQSQIDKMTEPAYMKINTDDVTKEMQEPLEKLQRFEELSQEEHRLELVGDTEGLEGVQQEMDEILNWIEENDEFKAQFNLEGLDRDAIREKLESGEIEFPATAVVDLQVEMNDSLKELTALIKYQTGLISEEELNLMIKYKVDESEIEDWEAEQKEAVVNFLAEHEEVDNWTPDEKTAMVRFIAKESDWYNALEDEEKEVVVNYIANGGELEDYTEEELDVIVKYLADTKNVDATVEEINKMLVEDKVVKVIAEDEATHVLNLWNTLSADPKFAKLSAQDQATYVIDLWNSMTPEEKQAYMNGELTLVDNASVVAEGATETMEAVPLETASTLKATDKATPIVLNVTSELDNLNGKTANTYIYTYKKTIPVGEASGTAYVGGTAHARGTANAGQRYSSAIGAYARGTDWRLPQDEDALVNEVGTESIVRDGRWFPIPGGAHIEKLKKNDIIFNAAQTEELVKYGKVISGGGHGKAYANGTATSGMNAYPGGSSGSGLKYETIVSGGVSKNGKGSGSGSGGGSDAEETKEILDWIETKIQRIEEAISRVERVANSAFKTFSTRSTNLVKQIGLVNDEIEIQKKAYDRYMEEAESVGLDENYAKLVRDGKIDIETITDEDLKEKISDYQTWYDKAIASKDAIEELKEQEKELYQQRFDNVIAEYDGILGNIDNRKSLIEAYSTLAETQGFAASSQYAEELKTIELNRQQELIAERDELQRLLQEDLNNGKLDKGSEAWYDRVSAIQELNTELVESHNNVAELNNEIRQISWDRFDELQEKISNITRDSDFLINLMSDADMYDEDTAKITDEGMATMGLHDANYEVYLNQVAKYKEELGKINEEIANNPADTALIERKEELIEKQQEAILAAKQEKQAMVDLVEEGINAQLNALKKLIDEYTTALDSQKDLYDYQKRVESQTKNISTLEKQANAYKNDDSEEGRLNYQKAQTELESAKQDLEETEYEKYLSNQRELLDTLYTEYENILNSRLDNIDALIAEVKAEVNLNASTISATLEAQAAKYGTDLTTSTSSISGVLSTLGTDITSCLKSGFSDKTVEQGIKNAIDGLSLQMGNLYKLAEEQAHDNIEQAKKDDDKPNNAKKEDPKPTPAPPTPSTPPTSTAPKKDETKTISVGGKINAGSAKIYSDAYGGGASTQYFKSDPIYTVLGEKNGYLKVRWHKVNSGVTGWFKKSDVKAYKTGAYNLLEDQLALTQEVAPEAIVRKDGSVLMPLTRGTSVLNGEATKNFYEFMNNPLSYMTDLLNKEVVAASPNNTSIGNKIESNVNLAITLPGVTNYEEFKSKMVRDKDFEKTLQSMTIDLVTGKSHLAKYKR